ncbi:sulfatase [Natronorubrum sp. DTA7]|uniref:sulfatase n=1 Tax=Natronorubrum sp. DTA7 TaxID=3447016 RepID=UPI003F84B721
MSTAGSVVLLTIDTLRADRFTSACFPETFSTFERDFAQFTNALSHGNATPLAFPPVMTARPVTGNGELDSETETIAERFAEQMSAGFSNNAHLTEERGYHRGFDLFHDLAPPDSPSLIDRLKRYQTLRESTVVVKTYRLLRKLQGIGQAEDGVVDPFPNPKTTADVVTDFVERRLEADDRFVWGHYMDPHKPFHPDQAVDGPEIDRSREEIEYLNSYEHSKDPLPDDDIAFLEALYESNIRYMDRELDRLFEWMRDRELYDDALIIVVGDHGELFGEHGYMFHPMDIDPVDELIRTPLLVKFPGNEYAGEEFDHLVQHADVLPTIDEVTDRSSGSIPEGAYPLTETTPRRVISKSNISIRLTEGDAVAYKRRDGTTKEMDQLSEQGRQKLKATKFPNVQTNSGVVKGVEEAERQRMLKNLGYQ